MFQRSLISVADQALISGLNFGIGLSLIAAVDKVDYGLYVQLFAAGVLLVGLMDALIGGAIANMMTRMPAHELASWLQKGQRVVWHLFPLIGFGVGALGLSLGLNLHNQFDWSSSVVLGCVVVLYTASLLQREYVRMSQFLLEEPIRVLRLDLVYAGWVILGLSGLWFMDAMTPVRVLFVMAMANGLAVFTQVGWPFRGHRQPVESLVKRIQPFWRLTQWGVVGCLVGWGSNNVFLFVSGTLLGLEATAQLNAARLLLMPLTLLSVAWGQASRAGVAKLIQAHDPQGLLRLLVRSAAFLGAASMLYSSLLWAAWPWLQAAGPFERYPELSRLTLWWVPYMLIFGVKLIGTVVLAVFEVYRPLLVMACSSLLIQLGFLMWLPMVNGEIGVIQCLMVSESFECLVIWLFLFPRAFRRLKRD